VDLNYPYTHELKVRFRDVDMMGHVNNSVYLTYLEEARTGFWEFLFRDNREFWKISFILASISIDYRSPAFYRDSIEICIRLNQIGTKSFSFHYLIRNKNSGTLLAEADSVMVMYDYEKEETYPIPQGMRGIFLSKGQ